MPTSTTGPAGPMSLSSTEGRYHGAGLDDLEAMSRHRRFHTTDESNPGCVTEVVMRLHQAPKASFV